MEATDEQHKHSCQETEQSPNSRLDPGPTINRLPDEVLVEIFDSYRRNVGYYNQWREEYVWFNLTHVCRNWRAVMFASSSRLDLVIVVKPEKPGHIKTILSGPLPILIDYQYNFKKVTCSCLSRIHAALEHHRDRIREIAFEGTKAIFDEFFEVTDCSFPMLESLYLGFFRHEPKIPDTGPDLSGLHPRRLTLANASFASVSGILFSVTALTDLTLEFDTAFDPFPEMSPLAYLQGMPCLRSLILNILLSGRLEPLWAPSQTSTPKKIVPLSKLTFLDYFGYGIFLDGIVAGLSAPSLQGVKIWLLDKNWPPVVHLPRFINEIEEHYHIVDMAFQERDFRLSLLTQSEYYDSQCGPYIDLDPVRRNSPESIMLASGILSTRLATVEELRVNFGETDASVWKKIFPWRSFLQQFPSVKTLRIEGPNVSCVIAPALLQHHKDPGVFLPALEEIKIGKNSSSTHESQRRLELAAFQLFVTARQQVGCPVKVFFST